MSRGTGRPADAAGAWLAEHGDDLVALRRHLHAHPELGRAEHDTTALLTQRLAEAGLAPKPLDVATGLTCDVGGGDGPLIVLRADIDALPLHDDKDVPYRSTVPGVCHACGHDVHTAAVLGAGLALAAYDADHRLPGTVRLVFQPAEEQMPGGALDVIAAGRVAGAALALSLHCDPTLTCGQIGVKSGALTSAADRIEVHLSGPGGHTSRPYRTVDLVQALASVATDVPAALARRVDARSGVSLVWGAVSAGTAHNAIPDSGVLRGTVRMLDRSAWAETPTLLTELVTGVAALFGATARVDYVRGVPPVVNDPRSTSLLAHAAEAVLGTRAVVATTQSLGGEDYAWYLEQVPGTMFRLGVRPPGFVGRDLDLHQGSFDVDEDAIAVAVRVLVRGALDALDLD